MNRLVTTKNKLKAWKSQLPLGTVKSRLNRARLELATSVRRRVQIHAVPPAGSVAEGSA